ncbi:vWA domain-containing protein [Virgibacillus sp. W0181]|uniref:vWA domain-containing protein n=1 Tax=Virgibacillus sp. W0181 TaxID=3391581 RepID=UPI003F4873DC
MKPNQWIDTSVDTGLFLQLQDLTTILSGQPDFHFEFDYGSTIDIFAKKVTGSRYWDTLNEPHKIAGYKTDLFLRTIGTFHLSQIKDLQTFLQKMRTTSISKFASQLVTLLEDLRLEELIKQERPGTKKDFSRRKAFLRHFFETQLAANVTRSAALDELFCLIYLTLQANQPDPLFPKANKVQLDRLETIKTHIQALFEAQSTSDVIGIVEKVTFQLEPLYKDLVNDYFTFPIYDVNKITHNTLFDELTRTDALANDDQEDVDEDNNEYIDERFSTWHRENENSDRKQTLLQFELDVGTKTNLMGGEARETEEADQALGSVQGTSGKSDKNDFSELETLEKKKENKGTQKRRNTDRMDNQYAVAIDKVAKAPTLEDEYVYKNIVQTIEPYKRKLTTTIEKTLEHKRNDPQQNLMIGRLSKKILPLIIDENPRIFYKKTNEAKEIDAVFTLLVDCSASMFQKMEETKRSIILFHEVLTKLKVPHSIVGFWEEANEVTENYQPNYFHIIRSHSDSFYKQDGAKIMQLEPQEDNRDGFSIRHVTRTLTAQKEKNKFLLVFSDGEPAAANYDQNGIIDTNVAVSEARKKGINVIGMFLANGEIDERERAMMKNIYGKEKLMIPAVSELPAHFAPLLKKLLLRTI